MVFTRVAICADYSAQMHSTTPINRWLMTERAGIAVVQLDCGTPPAGLACRVLFAVGHRRGGGEVGGIAEG